MYCKMRFFYILVVPTGQGFIINRLYYPKSGNQVNQANHGSNMGKGLQHDSLAVGNALAVNRCLNWDLRIMGLS